MLKNQVCWTIMMWKEERRVPWTFVLYSLIGPHRYCSHNHNHGITDHWIVGHVLSIFWCKLLPCYVINIKKCLIYKIWRSFLLYSWVNKSRLNFLFPRYSIFHWLLSRCSSFVLSCIIKWLYRRSVWLRGSYLVGAVIVRWECNRRRGNKSGLYLVSKRVQLWL